MTKKKITFIIEGVHENHYHVTLDTLLLSLDSFKQNLKTFDHAIHSRNDRSGFRVTKLSHSSPVTIEIEPYSIQHVINEQAQDELVEKYDSAIDAVLNHGQAKFDLPDSFYLSLKTIVTQVGGKAKSATIVVDDKAYELTPEHGAILERIMQTTEQCVSSYKGALEQINIHNQANTFNIYPITGPSKIKCIFPDHLTQLAIDAVGRDVFISGICKYRSSSPYPSEIDVMELDPCPAEEDLPSLLEMRGIAPNATGDLSSEDFVRELRNEW